MFEGKGRRCQCPYSLVDCSCRDGKPLPLFLLRLLHDVHVLGGMNIASVEDGVLLVPLLPTTYLVDCRVAMGGHCHRFHFNCCMMCVRGRVGGVGALTPSLIVVVAM